MTGSRRPGHGRGKSWSCPPGISVEGRHMALPPPVEAKLQLDGCKNVLTIKASLHTGAYKIGVGKMGQGSSCPWNIDLG